MITLTRKLSYTVTIGRQVEQLAGWADVAQLVRETLSLYSDAKAVYFRGYRANVPGPGTIEIMLPAETIILVKIARNRLTGD